MGRDSEMIICKNVRLSVSCLADGSCLTIMDYDTGQGWVLCDATTNNAPTAHNDLKPINAEKVNEDTLVVQYSITQYSSKQYSCKQYSHRRSFNTQNYTLIYILHTDCLEIVLPADAITNAIAVPGALYPIMSGAGADTDSAADTATATATDTDSDTAPDPTTTTAPATATTTATAATTATATGFQYVLPIMQGMLWDGGGAAFDEQLGEAHHIGFTMPMFGMLGTRGGLLVTAETNADTAWRLGKDHEGRTWVMNIQIPSLGEMGYDRHVRLYATRPTITDIAKTYRRRVIERGRFKSWDEKIKERPALDKLFGTVFGFIGYCMDDLDYVAECKKLKAYGFERAHLFPVRFNTYSESFAMGRYAPIRLDRETVASIKDLGYEVAPWSWINEGIDDGSAAMRGRYRKTADGEMVFGWEIDGTKWYKCCTSFMADYQQAANADAFNDMTWDHFDVITCATNGECHAPDHSHHAGRPLSKTEDREWIRHLLITGQAGCRPVSSENFNDAYAAEYDIGSVLALPQYGPWRFWPIPLTALVYHDSMIHTWWEAHGYNDSHFGRDMGKYQYGGGNPRLMSAMDALYGSPPLIFPFGAMYGWTGNGSETYLYQMRMEALETRLALAVALPVARLHERIGRLEMIDFSFETTDGYVQKTMFADGTTVYANFGIRSFYHERIGTIQPASWKVQYPEPEPEPEPETLPDLV